MACRVRRACEAWSASVQEIYRGNAKQRELRGVAETLHGMSTLRYASA